MSEPWLAKGDLVERLSGPVYSVGNPAGPRLLVGARGIVGNVLPLFPAHPCPDHEEFPECACGGDLSGTVPEREETAMVDWVLEDGTTLLRRAIGKGGEGTLWARVYEDPS